MLPKIQDKPKPIIPYHSFTRDILRRKKSQDNISKLKMIKQFLDQQQYLKPIDTQEVRRKNTSVLCRQPDLNSCFQYQESRTVTNRRQKQNHDIQVKSRRQSSTADAKIKSKESNIFAVQRGKIPIASSLEQIGERVKLNQLLAWKGKFSNKSNKIVKQLLNSSIKMSHKLNTYRIL